MSLSLKSRLQCLLMRLAGANTLYRRMTPDQMRLTMGRFVRGDRGDTTGFASIRNLCIPGPGGPLPLRIYTPEGSGSYPVLVFLHGGGWVLCNLDTHDAICRRLSLMATCIVVSVDYRLAPEHPFPAAPDDCLAAVRWTATHAAELGGDAERMAIAGDSAGGNLAAVTTLRLRDEGGAQLCGQLLLYPATDHYRSDTPSYREFSRGPGLSGDFMRWFWDRYLSESGQSDHPHASPLRAENLGGLPPARVITAGYDPLRDEGERYARRLEAAGVRVDYRCHERLTHGFMSTEGLLSENETIFRECADWLRLRFASAA